MRVLHTSDWHLGRSLHRADLRAAQEAFIDHLVEVVREERVGAVLVAGDVYDRAIPPLDAVALFEHALLELTAAGASVVVISGNHDSPQRLGMNSVLLDRAGVHLRTRIAQLSAPVLLPDRRGEIAVYAVPYLEPEAVRHDLDVPSASSHPGVLAAALGHLAADRSSRDPRRTVLLAHGWVHGAEPSDSERDISVGGVGGVPASLFAGFGYVALGHLHRPQQVTESLSYSGSALPYSFSEAGHSKGVWIADLEAPAGSGDVRFVPTPEFRRLTTLTGDLEVLLSAAVFTPYESDFVAVTLTDAVRPMGAMERLRARFDGILTLAWEPPAESQPALDYKARLRGRADRDIAADFVAYVRGAAADPQERTLLDSAFTAVRRESDAA